MAFFGMFKPRPSLTAHGETAVLEHSPSSPVAALGRPRPLPLIAPTKVPDGYEELAASLDYCPGALLRKRVRAFLFEQQIPVYERSDVTKYMTALAKKQSTTFIWRPMRQKDKDIWGSWGWGTAGEHDSYRGKTDVYGEIIPARILQDVQIISREFGDKVTFFVSDIGHPDPFIMVGAPLRDFSGIVFGCWDEPGFGVL